MSDTSREPFAGGCLCGAVRYTVSAEPMFPGHCQCSGCRKSGGSGHASMFAVPASAFSRSGATTVYESVADSGNAIGREFCPICGSRVFSTNAAMPDLAFISAASLDDPEIFKPSLVVFTAEAPSWDFVDPSLPAFEGMPDMTKLADG